MNKIKEEILKKKEEILKELEEEYGFPWTLTAQSYKADQWMNINNQKFIDIVAESIDRVIEDITK